jgi:hypothetical protein
MNVGKRAHTDALSWDPESGGSGDAAPGRRPLTAGMEGPAATEPVAEAAPAPPPVHDLSGLDDADRALLLPSTVARFEASGGQRKALVGPAPAATDPERHERLDPATAGSFGAALGADLSGVNIHTGDGVAAAHGAAAITFGNDVHFADGMRESGGADLLGHELAHTVQQGAVPVEGGAPTTEGTTADAEADADAAGFAAARGEARPVAVRAPSSAQRKAAPGGTGDGEDPIQGKVVQADRKAADQARGTRPKAAPAQPPPTGAAATAKPPMPAAAPTPAPTAQAAPPVRGGAGQRPPAAAPAPKKEPPAPRPAPAVPSPAPTTAPVAMARPELGGTNREHTDAVLAAGERAAAGVRAATAAAATAIRVEAALQVGQLRAEQAQAIAQLGATLGGQRTAVRGAAAGATGAVDAQRAAQTGAIAGVAAAQGARLQQGGQQHRTQAAATAAQKTAAVDSHATAKGAEARGVAQSRSQQVAGPVAGGGDPARSEAQADASGRVAARGAENIQKDAGEIDGQTKQAAGQFQQQTSQQVGQFQGSVDQAVQQGNRGIGEHAAASTAAMSGAAAEANQGIDGLGDAADDRLEADHDQAVAELTRLVDSLCAALDAQASAAATQLETHGGEVATGLATEATAIAVELADADPAQAATVAAAAVGQLDQVSGEAQASATATGAEAATALRTAGQEGKAEVQRIAQEAQQHLQQLGAGAAQRAAQAGTTAAGMMAEAGQTVGQQLTDATGQAETELGAGASQLDGQLETGAQQAQGAIGQGTEQALAEQQANVGQVESKKQEAVADVGGRYDGLKSEAEAQSKSEQEGGGQKGIWSWIKDTWSSVTEAIKKAFAATFGEWLGGFIYGILSALVVLLVVVAVLALIAFIFTPFVAAVVGICLLVAAAGFGIYSRFQMFKAYNGRSPGLGEGTLLVLLGIADVTGIPKIVEGIAGKRAFSNGHSMSKFESGEAVGSGIVEFIGFLVMARGIKGGLKGKGGTETVDPNTGGKTVDPNATKPVDPNATKPVEPIDPNATKPVEPVDPNATKPVDPNATKPTDPNATKPVEPVDPNATKPVEPVGPKPDPVGPKPDPVEPKPDPAGPKQDPKNNGRVDEPKEGVYDDLNPATQPQNWKFTDSITTEPNGTKVIDTHIEVNGKTGWVQRAYNPATKTFEMRNAFLDDVPRWVNEGTPMVEGKGTPTVTYLTMRQMKLLGVDYAGLAKVKMSTIQNFKAIIQLHVLRMKGVDPNQAVLQTHSVQYAETTIVQSGHKVVAAEVKGDIWKDYPIGELMKYYESRNPELIQKHNDMLTEFGEGMVTRDTQCWMNYDIVLEVAPFSGGGGN